MLNNTTNMLNKRSFRFVMILNYILLLLELGKTNKITL